MLRPAGELLSSREVELWWSGVLVAKEFEQRSPVPFYTAPRGARCTVSVQEERGGGSEGLAEMGGGYVAERRCHVVDARAHRLQREGGRQHGFLATSKVLD
jgi:hypothetical protein